MNQHNPREIEKEGFCRLLNPQVVYCDDRLISGQETELEEVILSNSRSLLNIFQLLFNETLRRPLVFLSQLLLLLFWQQQVF